MVGRANTGFQEACLGAHRAARVGAVGEHPVRVLAAFTGFSPGSAVGGFVATSAFGLVGRAESFEASFLFGGFLISDALNKSRANPVFVRRYLQKRLASCAVELEGRGSPVFVGVAGIVVSKGTQFSSVGIETSSSDPEEGSKKKELVHLSQ